MEMERLPRLDCTFETGAGPHSEGGAIRISLLKKAGKDRAVVERFDLTCVQLYLKDGVFTFYDDRAERDIRQLRLALSGAGLQKVRGKSDGKSKDSRETAQIRSPGFYGAPRQQMTAKDPIKKMEGGAGERAWEAQAPTHATTANVAAAAGKDVGGASAQYRARRRTATHSRSSFSPHDPGFVVRGGVAGQARELKRDKSITSESGYPFLKRRTAAQD